MAKTVRFYPILPREKRPKRLITPAVSGTATVLVKSEQIHVADLYTKPTGIRVANYINVKRTVQIGSTSKTFSKNKDWKQIVAKGGDATGNYSRSIMSHKPCVYSCYSESSGYTSSGTGRMHGGQHLLEMDWTVLEDQAVARLKHKLDGHIGKASLGPPLAESREIHRLVRQINGLGLSAVKAMLAIKKTKGKSALKQASDIWLGFGFGVNPLIQDVASAANAVLDYQTRENHNVRLSGVATRDYTSFTKTVGSDNIAQGMKMDMQNSHHHVQGVRIVAGIDIKTRSTASYGLADHLGLRVSALPSILWELTPYSWALDYAATVGPWLDDVFYTLPGVCIYVSKNKRYQVESTGHPVGVFTTGYKGWIRGSPSKQMYVQFDRAKLSALPSRQLRVKSVDEIAANALGKLLNLASVLAQRKAGWNDQPRFRTVHLGPLK